MGWPIGLPAQEAGAFDGLHDQTACLSINRHADSECGGVVADSSFDNGLSKRLFQEHGVGASLDRVRRPRFGLAIASFGATPTLVLVWNPLAVPVPEGIELSNETQGFAGQFERTGVQAVLSSKFEVQGPPRVDVCIGDANLFYLLEVEEPFTVG